MAIARHKLKVGLKIPYLFLLPMLLALQVLDIGRLYFDMGLTSVSSHGLHGFRGMGEMLLYLVTAVFCDAFYLLVILFVCVKVLGKFKSPAWLIKIQVIYFAATFVLMHFFAIRVLRYYFKEPADLKALSLLVDGDYAAVLRLNQGFALILLFTVFLAIVLNILIVYGVYVGLKKSGRTGNPLILPSMPRRILFILIFLFASSTYASYYLDVRFALNQKLSYTLVFWPVEKIFDFDRDGFGSYGLYRDPDIFSKNRTPYDFSPHFQIKKRQDESPSELRLKDRKVLPLKNIVLIVLEGMRPNILWKLSDTNWIAPNLNALAKTGSYSRHMYSHTGTTIFSKQAIFFGTAGLLQNHKSIFSDLSEKMYKIGVFSCMDESFGGLDRISKMRDLADVFCDAACGGSQPVFADTSSVNRAIDEDWVYHKFKKYAENENWSVPHFLYFNLQATHYPYHHSKVPAVLNNSPITQAEIFKGDTLKLKRTYYNSVHYIDQTIGKIIQTLKEEGQWDNTLLIAVGDHGESLFDDGSLGHGSSLDDTQTNTLIVSSLPLFPTDALLGLDQVKDLMLNGLSGDFNGASSAKSVIQFLGLLHEPIQIATVDGKGNRLIIDFRKSRIFDPHSDFWHDLHSLPLGSPLDVARNQLMHEWTELKRTSLPVAATASPF